MSLPLSPEDLAQARAFAARPHQLLINGTWCAAQAAGQMMTENPATATPLTAVAAAQAEDVDLAVRAARHALEDGPWGRMSPADRSRLLWRFADLMARNADVLAALECLDIGKPYGQARLLDVGFAIELAEYFAGWPSKLGGETMALSNKGSWQGYTLREPVGVVGLIVPWNAPLMMAVAKLAPALAAGCTVILKPAEASPLSALYLGDLFAQAGFPAGVVNILTGTGAQAGHALAAHPDVDKISFTGSPQTGRHIVTAAMGNFKRVSLELGGKSPVIIFPDADLDMAAAAAARAIFANAGQVCNAGSRLYVHRKVYDRVLEAVIARAASLRLGDGFAPETEMGPLISKPQLDRVLSYVDLGQREGAFLRIGGATLPRAGHFLQPTVFEGVAPQMRLLREEIFGPVLCAMSFDGDSMDAIALQANATPYGLGAQIWTRDLRIAHGMAAKVKAGTIRVNGSGLDPALPFGGMKTSGWGREYGRAGVEAYTELKSVAINYA